MCYFYQILVALCPKRSQKYLSIKALLKDETMAHILLSFTLFYVVYLTQASVVTKAKECHQIKCYLCFAQVVLLLQLSNIVPVWFK